MTIVIMINLWCASITSHLLFTVANLSGHIRACHLNTIGGKMRRRSMTSWGLDSERPAATLLCTLKSCFLHKVLRRFYLAFPAILAVWTFWNSWLCDCFELLLTHMILLISLAVLMASQSEDVTVFCCYSEPLTNHNHHGEGQTAWVWRSIEFSESNSVSPGLFESDGKI